MKTSLSGIGNEGGWQVEIDEIEESALYSLTITSCRITLQIAAQDTSNIRALQSFLRASRQDGELTYANTFGGNVAFVYHDGAVRIRIRQPTELGTNLCEVVIEPTESANLAVAMDEAISEWQPS